MISSVGRKVFGFGNSNSASTSPKNTSATLSSHSNRFATSTTVRKESPSATHSEHSKQSSSTLTGQTPPVASSSIASREETDTRKVDVENLEKDSVKLPAVNQPATVTDNSYMPHTLSSTSENQSSSSGIPAGFTGYFPDGLTHEEKSVAIKRLSKMDRCRTSGGQVTVELSSNLCFADGTTRKSSSKVKIDYGWVCQAGYYPESLNKPNQDNLLVLTANKPLFLKPSNGSQMNVESINGGSSSRLIGMEKSYALFCVFDGHGQYGTECSTYAATQFQPSFQLALEEYVMYKKDAIVQQENPLAALEAKFLTTEDIKSVLISTLEAVNQRMHAQKHVRRKDLASQSQYSLGAFNDLCSGTTAICVLCMDDELISANAGDSRAVMGLPHFELSPRSVRLRKVQVVPLSVDQTPFRKDERDRCRQAGGVIMSMEQMEGIIPFDPNQEDWGTEEECSVDPPRLWSSQPGGPGVAFTRSLGDELVEKIGCIATPEVEVVKLPVNSSLICVASDGVFEFLNSETVCEVLAHFQAKDLSEESSTGAYEAARALVAEAYKLWLHYEVRTDDITSIVIFLQREADTTHDPLMPISSPPSLRAPSAVAKIEQRPVRRVISKEKRQLMRPVESDSEDDLPPDVSDATRFEKTDEERQEIIDSIQTNFLFQHLTEKQLQQVLDSFERVTFKQNEVVIKQGEKGDKFYVVSDGTFECFVQQADPEKAKEQHDADLYDERYGLLVHTYLSTPTGFGNPSFGDLALMFSEPRAATIVAKTEAVLWALHRKVFRRLFVKGSSNQVMVKLLKEVPIFGTLSKSQLQRLADVVSEEKFEDGATVIKQGDIGDALFIVKTGTVKCIVDTSQRPYSRGSLSEGSECSGSHHSMNSSNRRRFSRSKKSNVKTVRLNNPNEVSGQPGGEDELVKEVMRIKPGGYFGERALLYDEPRAASVYAVGSVQCLCLSRASFERLLGPLQTLIQRHSRLREEEALSKEIIKQNKVKVFNIEYDLQTARPPSTEAGFGFHIFESAVRIFAPDQEDEKRAAPEEGLVYYQAVLATSKKTVTVKSCSLAYIEQKKLQEKVERDRFLLMLCVNEIEESKESLLDEDYPFVSRLLGTLVGKTGLHLVLQANVVGSLYDLVNCDGLAPHGQKHVVLSESTVCYIAACIINGLDFLHSKSVVSRSVNLNSLQIDESGVITLTDLSLGKYLEDDADRAYTMCGDPLYFAPEQILNHGADLSVDWWALGLLLYELLYSFLPYETDRVKAFLNRHPESAGRQMSFEAGRIEETNSVMEADDVSELTEVERFTLITQFRVSQAEFPQLPDNGSTGSAQLSVQAQKLLKALLETNMQKRGLLDNSLTNHPWLTKYCLAANQLEGYARSPIFNWCEKRVKEIAAMPKITSFDEQLDWTLEEQKAVWYRAFFDE